LFFDSPTPGFVCTADHGKRRIPQRRPNEIIYTTGKCPTYQGKSSFIYEKRTPASVVVFALHCFALLCFAFLICLLLKLKEDRQKRNKREREEIRK
jgi:hypothetical protein